MRGAKEKTLDRERGKGYAKKQLKKILKSMRELCMPFCLQKETRLRMMEVGEIKTRRRS